MLATREPDIAAFARCTLSFRDGRLIDDRPVVAPRVASEVLAGLQQPGAAA
ncbi:MULTISPECIES: hypothetical protein [unclassified Azospirillum]|uniref:hypothetical protein n=1 Tax=unclassified Azospirillum TaxID=2630922 RepID=UPI0013048CAD|nr:MULTISPECIES: hypothetical protein [unclassified Azospirillum]